MKSIEEYKEFVEFLSRNRDSRTFLNADEEHALVVLVEILRSAQKEVLIFANNLYNHIGYKSDYIIAISEFIERGGTLKILLNDFKLESAKTSDLFRRLAYYISEGKPVYIKTSSAHPYRKSDPNNEIHFTIGDRKSYRLETNIEEHTAECSLNNEPVAQSLASFFDGLFEREDAKDAGIANLFEQQ